MKMLQIILILTASPLLFSPAIADTPYSRDKWQTLPRDHEFEAFITSFDGADGNSGDRDSDKWRISEWAAFEIRKFKKE